MSISYPCGCVNEVHRPGGVLRSVSKCAWHRDRQRDPATLGEAYYTELGVLKGGKLAETNHVAELVEALGPIPSPPGSRRGRAFEVGCGCSPYVTMIREAAYDYFCVESSGWAADWMAATYDVPVLRGRAEQCWTGWGKQVTLRSCDLILAAHVVEHLDDAPAALSGLAGLLAPGGELWVVVPDDSDPTNPDHLWYFRPDTLSSCLEAAGLTVARLAARRYVPHERFLYARAVKRGVSPPAPLRDYS